MNNIIKGYKVFGSDFKCRDFQYEVGKTYEFDGNIELCDKGFHFCKKLSDCFNYYSFDSNNKVAEIEASGLVETRDDKSVTDKISIIKELTWIEVLALCNTGDYNTGNRNTGNRNTGFFCAKTPKILIFDEITELSRKDILNNKGLQAMKWNFENNIWIYSSSMTEEEKEIYTTHETTGGYLKSLTYKETCKNMWECLTEEEKKEVKLLPNFNRDKFEFITGIKID